ncbi:hypothetical protein FF38_12326 [Lucilia cuprina]|uniref:Uncharacterized protein n=1 Tax=Lucilia cuprina TaxID=7375 RepID=A0A0L0C5H0_LUCCU|nr:hypothetical protein FF38_12326 [Lucilia cuprina]
MDNIFVNSHNTQFTGIHTTGYTMGCTNYNIARINTATATMSAIVTHRNLMGIFTNMGGVTTNNTSIGFSKKIIAKIEQYFKSLTLRSSQRVENSSYEMTPQSWQGKFWPPEKTGSFSLNLHVQNSMDEKRQPLETTTQGQLCRHSSHTAL